MTDPLDPERQRPTTPPPPATRPPVPPPERDIDVIRDNKRLRAIEKAALEEWEHAL